MLFRGENGAMFEIDPDSLRPAQREAHDAAVSAGRLVAEPVKPPRKSATKPATD
jgi:hypothetical protein